MRSVRSLWFVVVSLLLVTILASCSRRAESAARPGSARPTATGQARAVKATATGAPVAGQSTVTLTAAPSPAPPSNNYYVVGFGDTLNAIAQRFGVDETVLVNLNHLGNVNEISVGQRLLLPAGAVVVPTALPEPLDRVRVPILLYHHLALLKETAGSEWQVTTVTPGEFEEQMTYLAYSGYHTVRVSDLVDALEGRKTLPAKPVAVTFDDGWIDGYETAFPILQQYGLIATFFIPAEWIGSSDNEIMNWDQIQALSRAGMEIGSHSMTHPYLTQLDVDTLAWELQNSRTVLQEHVDQPIDVFAYPFGIYDDNVRTQVAVAGYRAALTINDGLYVTSDYPYDMPRLTVPYGGSLEDFKTMIGETAPSQDASN